MKTTIYGLRCPDTGQIRYVGKARDPRERLIQHLCPSHLRQDTYKNRWLRSLRARGLRPELVILEEVDAGDWKEAEARWITTLRAQGLPLTNTTAGGEGTPGYNHSPETITKIREAQLGIPKSAESRARMSAAHAGKPRKPLAEQTRAKIGDRQRDRKEANASSQYLGVSWIRAKRRWVAQLRVDGRPLNLGTFLSEEDAARAYDRAARLHRGPTARLNFPLEG